MFGSSILEVVIGLVFIYLLYSLLATTVKEGIATMLGLRARMLKKALGRMLDDGFNKPMTILTMLKGIVICIAKGFESLFFFIFSINGKEQKTDKLVDKFYNQPGIKYLGENVLYKKPSYISPQAFSKGVVDTLKEMGTDKTVDGTDYALITAGIEKISNANETKKFIGSLLKDSGNDLVKFKILLETWFNETMDRTTGWYKRQAQGIIFVIGLILAVSFNVDTLLIVKKLSKDKEARKSLVDMAAGYSNSHKDIVRETAVPTDSSRALFHYADSLVKGDINDANTLIAIGWNVPERFDTCPVKKGDPEYKNDISNCKDCLEKMKGTDKGDERAALTKWQKVKYVLCMSKERPRKLLGFLITALAISLGAPFWFDLLNKLIQLRTTGKKPDEPASKTPTTTP